VLSMIKNMLVWCRISKSGTGSDDQPKQQVEYMGKVADAVIIYPYGMAANIPADVLALKVAVNGDPENRAVIGCGAPNMPALNEGEVAIYHPVSGDIIKMTASGIEIISSNVTINAANMTLDGDVTITGDAAVKGDLTVGPLAKDFLTHTHIGSPTAPAGAITPTGVVI